VSAATLESDTISLAKNHTVMDVMEIRTSRISIYRLATPIRGGEEKEYTLLEPLEFVALVKRNISRPSELYPNTSVSLDINTIKVLFRWSWLPWKHAVGDKSSSNMTHHSFFTLVFC